MSTRERNVQHPPKSKENLARGREKLRAALVHSTKAYEAGAFGRLTSEVALIKRKLGQLTEEERAARKAKIEEPTTEIGGNAMLHIHDELITLGIKVMIRTREHGEEVFPPPHSHLLRDNRRWFAKALRAIMEAEYRHFQHRGEAGAWIRAQEVVLHDFEEVRRLKAIHDERVEPAEGKKKKRRRNKRTKKGPRHEPERSGQRFGAYPEI